jgi:Flp pilus assembly pilin Flp
VRKVKRLVKFLKDEEGVVMIEYALIGALIGVALIITLGLLANSINDIFHNIIDALDSA